MNSKKYILLESGIESVPASLVPVKIGEALHPDDEIMQIVAAGNHLREFIAALVRGELVARRYLDHLPMLHVTRDRLGEAFCCVEDFVKYVEKFGLEVHFKPNDACSMTTEAEPVSANDEASQSMAASVTPIGITKKQVIAAFTGMHFDEKQWAKYLASPAPWLKVCRVQRGSKSWCKQPSLWNPVLVAVALTEGGRNVPFRRLDGAFAGNKFLACWQDEWRDKSEILR